MATQTQLRDLAAKFAPITKADLLQVYQDAMTWEREGGNEISGVEIPAIKVTRCPLAYAQCHGKLVGKYWVDGKSKGTIKGYLDRVSGGAKGNVLPRKMR